MNFFEDDIKQPDENLTADPVNEVVDLGLAENDQADYSINLKKSNRQTLLLLAVCVASIALVYFAGFSHKSSSEQEEQTATAELDLVLAKLVGINNVDDSQQLIDAFYELPGGKQVKLDELNKNPFVFAVKEDLLPQVEVQVQEVDIQKQLNAQFDKMKLDGIMRGYDLDRCVIDGQIYKVGDTLAHDFSIMKINVDSVVLQANDIEYTLNMK